LKKFIQPYNPNWQTGFNKIQKVIQSELSDLKIEIQHVGSTSIPGLFAKPVLDIDIIIEDKDLLCEITSKLEKIGYASKGEQGISGRFAFRQTSDFTPLTLSKKMWHSHHLYVCYSDSLALKNHLLFRDTLRSDYDLAERYSQLKKTLTRSSNTSREQYTKGKTDFILSVLATLGLNKTELKEINDSNVQKYCR
jgi:GrpB-like predicted nucleotidyltransferase (UPF0157 family)